jgi:hypothetical protein
MYVPYEGGPVVYCPVIYTSFWGPSWNSSPNNLLSSQLNQFVQDLLVSRFMNVLTQYGPAGIGLFSQAS